MASKPHPKRSIKPIDHKKKEKAPVSKVSVEGEVASSADYGNEEEFTKLVSIPPPDSADNIRVAVRVRPPNNREEADNDCRVCVTVPPDRQGVVLVDSNPFTYDLAFPMDYTQLQVFEAIGVDIVRCAYNGYNASLFAYGQTSSGKSFSMMGVPNTSLVGLIPRIARLLFYASTNDSTKEVLVETSYMEIYNEKLRDLLGKKDNQADLKVRENKQLGVHVVGLSKEVVTSEQETLAVIEHGTKHRTTAATLYNSESSRSHAVFEITVQSKYNVGGTEMRARSRVALIDLAGSERSDKLHSKGKALQEGNNINKSLTVLGRCIRALIAFSKDKKTIVPFRESVLTWYLRDSLSGNARTTMLAACSPVASNIEETLSTLRYADSAKSIKTAAVKNEDPAQAKIRELSNELEALKKRLEEAESGGGGVRKFDSMRSMSPREKESLLAELDSQMSILKDNDGFQAQKRRSRRTSMVFKQEKIKEYPMLSCLSKDNMLSHVMNVAIFHQLPFVIGRTETKSTTNLTDIPTSGPETSHLDDHGSESQDGIDGGVGYKNNFNLDGMGIQSHHCMFEKYIKKPQSNLSNIQEGDEDNEAAVRVSTDKLENLNLNNIGNGGVNKNDNDDDEDCLSIRALSSTSVVCVNGVPINEMDGLPPIKLQHLDRIVLGPCRLICLYLTHELSYKDRNYWNYDACFTELSSRGKEIPRSLLSTSRCKLVDQLSQLECEEIAQCNAIACEMGCNVRFACDLVVQGGQGLSKPNYLMDEFLDSNQTKIVINVFVDTELPKIKTAKDLLIAMKRPKKHEGSVGPLVPPTPNTAIVQGRLLDALRDNPFDSYNIEQLKNSGEHHLLHDGNTNNNENGGGGGEDDESLLFDPLGKDSKLVSLCTLEIDDFQDIFIHLKATHASLSRLTGGLSDAMDTSESLLSSAPPSPLSTSPPSSSSSSSSHKIGLFQTVFNKLDIDHSGKIDHHELQQALKEFNNHTTKDNENNESDTHHGHHHNHQYDHDFIDQICIEERLSDDTELTYDEFEMFLISFLQHQFYRCIEHVVTNRTLFIDIGGRDITTLLAMQDHELVMKHRLASLTHMVASRNHHHHSDHHHSEDERRLSRKSVNKEKDTKDGSGGGGGGASDSHKPKRIPKPHPHRKSSSLSGPNSVVKFLQECNLNHHSKTLIQLGVDNVKDLFDSKLLTDEDLLESAHFTLEEITIFRNMIASYKLQPISEMLIGAGLEDEMLSFVNAGIGCLPDASPEELEKSAQQGILLTKLFNAMKGNETYV